MMLINGLHKFDNVKTKRIKFHAKVFLYYFGIILIYSKKNYSFRHFKDKIENYLKLNHLPKCKSDLNRLVLVQTNINENRSNWKWLLVLFNRKKTRKTPQSQLIFSLNP